MISPVTLLSSTGPWLYPLAAAAACLVGSVVRAFLVIRSDRPVPPAGPPHHAVLVWGVLAVVVGLLGTVVGSARLALGARAVAGPEETDLQAMMDVVWSGAVVVISPVTLGLALLCFSLVCWLLLGFALNRSVESTGTR